MDRLKFSMLIDPRCEREELEFAVQLGFEGVYTWLRDEDLCYDAVCRIKQKTEAAGLKLYTAHSLRLSKNTSVILGQSGRDAVIEEYQILLHTLGRAGVPSTNFTWEPAPTDHWNHPIKGSTRLAACRSVDNDVITGQPLLHGREYTREELWANYRYFIKAIMPVADEAKVGVALHPNDPPIDGAGGVPFLIRSYADYQQAMAAHDSPFLGVEFCFGCWLEGGDAFGDLEGDFRELQARNKVWVIHFRNTSGPLPSFHETHLDNGYGDMARLARMIASTGYTRSLTLDHVPIMRGKYGRDGSLAYNMGYCRAIFDAAYENERRKKTGRSSCRKNHYD